MTFWDAEAENRIRKLWNDGATASVIAAALGVSRSTVCAKARRMNLASRLGPKISRADFKHKVRSKAPISAHVVKPRKPMERLPLPAAEPVPDHIVSFENLEPHHCRWIHGDVGGQKWGYCGRTREVGSYCHEHQRRAYTSVYVPHRAIQNAECNWKIAKAKKETVE